MQNSLNGKAKFKNEYRVLKDGRTMIGNLSDGLTFAFDFEDYEQIRKITWYPDRKNGSEGKVYVIDHKGNKLHQILLEIPKGYEVDHKDMNPLNNCRSNLRICTHQQNQCNQNEQCNNSSGVSGVSFYPPRGKFRARIKASQHDIHLGYFQSFIEAVQARNEGVKLMFGEYGRLNDVPEAPTWIKNSVYEKCSRHFDKAAVSIFS
ncbi:MAG: HNH endonuclease [Bacteroidales bacterium]